MYAVVTIDPKANPMSGTATIYVAQPNPGCAASPIGTGAPVALQLARQSGTDRNVDLDGDNCSDVEELSDTGSLGGLRDPYNWGDFMSVHTGPLSNLAKDQVVSVADISAVVARFGTNDAGGTAKVNRNTDPKSRPTGTIYHPSYDRGGPIPNGGVAGSVARQYPANAGAGAGAIAVGDISATVSQFGHSCAAAP